MSKRRLDVGDSVAKTAKVDEGAGAGGSLGIKPGIKMNPHTAQPYTPRYFELFRKRITLPVWEYQVYQI